MARRKQGIPSEIRQQAEAIVAKFNEGNPLPPKRGSFFAQLFGRKMTTSDEVGKRSGDYVVAFRGDYLYLHRIWVLERPYQVCRLKWTGNMDKWEFAIYRHSRNFYDPDEWFFPGAEEVDGTIEGAMRAGIQAYPL